MASDWKKLEVMHLERVEYSFVVVGLEDAPSYGYRCNLCHAESYNANHIEHLGNCPISILRDEDGD